MKTANKGFYFHGFVFRPTLWLTVCTALGASLIFGLAFWQVERLKWKTVLIDERVSRSESAPISLPAMDDDPAGFEFYRLHVAGEFLHDEELYLAARSMRGNIGHHIMTPLVMDDGATILVNRGWVPNERHLPDTRSEGQVTGEVSVEGVIRRQTTPGVFVPDNQPEDNLWLSVDIPAMAQAAGLDNVLPYYIEAGPQENPGGYPIGGQSRIYLPNDHLQYAITWFSLGLVLLVIFVIYSTTREDRDDGEPS